MAAIVAVQGARTCHMHWDQARGLSYSELTSEPLSKVIDERS
jgi:hypothetical protein